MISYLVLLGAEVFTTVSPIDNIFKARAETPVIEEAIADFQDTCLTFMLHESAVSKFEDLKHFDSMIETSGYEKRQFTNNEQAAASMGVYGNSFIRPYTKANESYDLILRWRQPVEHFTIGRYSEDERDAILKMPYGKYNGLACILSVKLPKATKFSNIESEILNYDKDWKNPPKTNFSSFAIFKELQPIQYIRHQNVNFEENNFVFRIIFNDPASAPRTTKTGEPNPYFDDSSNPTLTFVMTRPIKQILELTKRRY